MSTEHFAGVDTSQIQQDLSSPESSNSGNDQQNNELSNQDQQDYERAITELDKLEKFKFQGREYTPSELRKEILRHQDYTKKTQKLSEERKSFETNKKFSDNLVYDLEHVRRDPNMATQFIKIYPQEFHKYLKDILGATSQSQGSAQNQQQQPQRQSVDYETLSKLQKLESYVHTQEVAKNERLIESNMAKFEKKFPDAVPEMVLGRVYEAIQSGAKNSDSLWENAYKQVDAQMKNIVKAKYGSLVKQQTQANKKAADVEGGGGTVGRAPVKVKSFKDATALAIKDLTGKG